MYGEQIVQLYHSIVETDTRQTPFDASTRTDFLTWQRKARRRLLSILGEMPLEPVDFDVRRETVEETEQFTRERLVYWTRPDVQATAYLLTPRGVQDPVPAVLCLHGHSSGGKDEVVDPTSQYRGFGRRLAEQGLVVLAPDQIGFGERKLPEG
ncbi:MAG: hypothetical protein HY318_10880, partial [Armatimonadetes bacterium]|nr:hypothetical protein [Armatimonadota bacterium]